MISKQKLFNFFSGAILAQGVTQSQLFQDLKVKFLGSGGAAGPAGAESAGQLITQVLEIMLFVAGSLAVVFLVVGGIKYVLSRGNEEQAESAKKTMTAAIWGLVIIIMAYAIVYIITVTLIQGDTGTG